MTQSGVNTPIVVNKLETMKNLTLLCKLEMSLYKLDLVLSDNNKYDELMKQFLKFIKLPQLKVCFYCK